MKILLFTNFDDDEKLEDIWIAREFQKDGHQVILTSLNIDSHDISTYDVIIKRNTWYSEEEDLKKGMEQGRKILPIIKKLSVPKINFSGNFDVRSKEYLVDLYELGYPVIPSVNQIENIEKLPIAEKYMLKPKEGYDGIGQMKGTLEEIKEKFSNEYIIQPVVKFSSEIQFYFINQVYQYALQFTPSKVPIYPVATIYQPTEKELKLAKQFANLNTNFIGIQRIDFLQLESGKLVLVEIEDDSPYLDLDVLPDTMRNRFLTTYKKMVYQYIKEYKNEL